MRVGFIGLGSQGAPMARRIVEAGHPLTIWARRPESTEPFADTAATVARSPAELAENSDVVCLCVVNDADVESVITRDDGVLAGLAARGIIAIHATVHPDTCRRMAAHAAARGVDVVDAPVSGGGGAAAEGKLLVMVGGDDAVVERVRPVFATFAFPVLHLGALGSGQMAKLLNNLLFTAQLTVAIETYEFAVELGIDRTAMAEVLASGSGGSRAAGVIAGSQFDTSGLRQVAAGLLAKDVGIMFDVADRVGATKPPHVAELARSTLERFANDE
jgi:3-hydroxyisobutyrate dehydrogenase-like beta-hydroxyacid dehydrogenase